MAHLFLSFSVAENECWKNSSVQLLGEDDGRASSQRVHWANSLKPKSSKAAARYNYFFSSGL